MRTPECLDCFGCHFTDVCCLCGVVGVVVALCHGRRNWGKRGEGVGGREEEMKGKVRKILVQLVILQGRYLYTISNSTRKILVYY